MGTMQVTNAEELLGTRTQIPLSVLAIFLYLSSDTLPLCLQILHFKLFADFII